MREPTCDEMQIALILMKQMTLTEDARALLKRIAGGEVVQKEGLVLLRSLGDTFVQQRLGISKTPTPA
jgi:hypothetical protein